eukprot:Tamp_13648.p1 GENE.Tamp_13648~~Tamp_13648.p1  ORF type:complete len:468 (-),score=97.78 Tamp_13648:294-1664(-)
MLAAVTVTARQQYARATRRAAAPCMQVSFPPPSGSGAATDDEVLPHRPPRRAPYPKPALGSVRRSTLSLLHEPGLRAWTPVPRRGSPSPRLCGVACLVVVLQWATADLPARGASCWERACVAGRVGRAGEPRPSVACRAPDSRGPQPCDGRGPTPSVLRLRGGAKSIATKPRTWKQQSKHHAEKRRSSIRKKRGKNAQEATYTKEARANLRKVEDARRLRELSENEERKRRLKEERGTDFNHELRLEYLRATEEADRRRAEKYQTLEDYSDSVEREIEELRQKRGDKRGLTVPDWRGEHPSYWKEVDQEVADQLEDLSNPDKVWKEATEEGNVWKLAALNRHMEGKKMQEPSKLALTLDASGGSIVSRDGGGGGGMQLAERQAANLDPGPMQFEEASSSYEREEEQKEKETAAREAEQARQRKTERKRRVQKLRAAARQREEESERAMVRPERELA